MKKILLVVLAACALLSFASCGMLSALNNAVKQQDSDEKDELGIMKHA